MNAQLIRNILPGKVANHIIDKIRPPRSIKDNDTPKRILESNGKFFVRSVWQYLRQREQPNKILKEICVRGLPFKIALFMCRMWKFKGSMDDRIGKWGYEGPSRYWSHINIS